MPIMQILSNNIAALRGNPKRYLRRTVLRNFPRMLTYGDTLTIEGIPSAFPPMKTIFPEPYVLRLDESDREHLGRNWYFSGREVIITPSVELYEIKNGLIFPDSGFIADAGGRIIQESAKSRGNFLKGQDDFYRLRRGTVELKDDGFFSTIHCGIQAKSIGHWVLDALPRLYALGQVPFEVTILQNEGITDWNKELLAVFLPRNVSVKYVSGIKPFKAKRVLLSPYMVPSSCAIWRPEIVRFMRETLYKYAGSQPSARKRRFFIWRKDVSGMHGPNRKVSNEENLISMLSNYGIEPIAPETLTLKEKVELYRDSELIIGTPGSGMAVSFLAKDAALIEIFPNGNGPGLDLQVWAWSIAKTAGLKYYPLYHSYSGMPKEFQVDVERVEKTIHSALAGLSK